MSKQVRLEIPLYHEDYYLQKMWLKIEGNKTIAFADANCTFRIPTSSPNFAIDISLPDEMQKVKVFCPYGLAPVDYISLSWDWLDSRCNLKITKLQKLLIIFDDRAHEIPVIDGKPDRIDWIYYSSVSTERSLLLLKKWALIVSTLEDAIVGTLYLNSNLIEQ